METEAGPISAFRPTNGQGKPTVNEGKWLLSSSDLIPSGVKIFFSHSYVMKYMPLAGTSVSGKKDVK